MRQAVSLFESDGDESLAGFRHRLEDLRVDEARSAHDFCIDSAECHAGLFGTAEHVTVTAADAQLDLALEQHHTEALRCPAATQQLRLGHGVEHRAGAGAEATPQHELPLRDALDLGAKPSVRFTFFSGDHPPCLSCPRARTRARPTPRTARPTASGSARANRAADVGVWRAARTHAFAQ